MGAPGGTYLGKKKKKNPSGAGTSTGPSHRGVARAKPTGMPDGDVPPLSFGLLRFEGSSVAASGQLVLRFSGKLVFLAFELQPSSFVPARVSVLQVFQILGDRFAQIVSLCVGVRGRSSLAWSYLVMAQKVKRRNAPRLLRAAPAGHSTWEADLLRG